MPSVKSSKAKARRLQDLIRDKVRELFSLGEKDVRSAIMGEPGVDIKLSHRAMELFPYGVEAKAYNKIAVFRWWEQAVINAEKEGLTPMLVFKEDRKKPLVALEIDEFFKLLEVRDKSHNPFLEEVKTLVRMYE